MRKLLFLLILSSISTSLAAREVELGSKYSVKQTAERYVQVLKQAGIQVLRNEISTNGITGKPEARVVFANPMFGQAMGNCHAGERKDVPMTTLIREDGSKKVRVFFELAEAPVNTFGVIECGNETDNLNWTLEGFASAATE